MTAGLERQKERIPAGNSGFVRKADSEEGHCVETSSIDWSE